MTTKVSVAQATNVLPRDLGAPLAKILQAMQKDIAANNAALASITAQLDAAVVAGHPYSVAANNPSLNSAQ